MNIKLSIMYNVFRHVRVNAIKTACGLLLCATTIAYGQMTKGQEPTETLPANAAGSTSSSSSSGQRPVAVSFVGPLKIVTLLWDSNPANAANTLTRSISTAIGRGELELLRAALEGLRPKAQAVLTANDYADARYAPSLAVAMLSRALPDAKGSLEQAMVRVDSLDQRQMLWQLWLMTDAPSTQDYFVTQLVASKASDATTASATAQWTSRLISDALATHRTWASRTLVEHWDELSPEVALTAIEPLTANAQSMELLVDAIVQGHVSKDLVNTNQLRKWLASDNAELVKKIETIWGTVRIEDDKARQQLVSQTLDQLAHGARGSASRGGVVFDRVCSQCHVLHGRGFEVGPNIVGNGRGNLQQLVSNVLDPSLVIGEAFQSKTVMTVDGEVFAGLIAAENDRYIKLKIQGGKVVEFDKEDIEQVKSSSKSLMPEGVETQMQPQELLDLFAYLCLLKPLDAPDNEFIPGTPAGFVEP